MMGISGATEQAHFVGKTQSYSDSKIRLEPRPPSASRLVLEVEGSDYRLVGRAYSFIMFGCFSKKKKLKSSAPEAERAGSAVGSVAPPAPEPATPSVVLPPARALKKSKFCPIEPGSHAKTQSELASNSLSAIDRMLEEELREPSLPYAQENTARFADLPDQLATSHFCSIVPLEATPPGFAAMVFQDTKSQSFEVGSCGEEGEEEERHMVPRTSLGEVHTIEELTDRSTSRRPSRKSRRSSRLASSTSSGRAGSLSP